MLVGMLAAGLLPPIGAENEPPDAEFGKITCREIICSGISVTHSDSSEYVTLIPSSIMMFSSEGLGAHISVNGRTGMLSLGKRGDVSILGGESSRYIRVKGENGSVTMDVDEHGGRVAVFGKGSDESRAIMGVDEYGNGAVSTWDKNGYRLATLK